MQQCHELLKFGRSAVQRDAFVALCDLLVAFAKQLRCSGQLGALVYSPGTALQQTMLVSRHSPAAACMLMYSPPPSSSPLPQDYVLEEVLGGMEEEVEEHSSNEEAMAHAERLNDGRVLLAGFLKLAMFLILDMKLLAPVFRHYLTVGGAASRLCGAPSGAATGCCMHACILRAWGRGRERERGRKSMFERSLATPLCSNSTILET